jgi:signal transduction histidine kinase
MPARISSAISADSLRYQLRSSSWVTELEAGSAAFTERSVQRERTRIARELHDIASHHSAGSGRT